MPSLRRPLRCPLRRGDSGDRLFCRHISSLSPPFGKDLFTQETLRLLDEVGATKTVHQWETEGLPIDRGGDAESDLEPAVS